MAAFFINMLGKNFKLNDREISMLGRTMRSLNRIERRFYFENIKPRDKDFKNFFVNHYYSLDKENRKKWVDIVVNSMIQRGGEPDLSDSIIMRVIGRIHIYNCMREKAEKEGIKLNALVNFGGIGTVIMLAGGITAIVLYLLSK